MFNFISLKVFSLRKQGRDATYVTHFYTNVFSRMEFLSDVKILFDLENRLDIVSFEHEIELNRLTIDR